MSDHPSFKLTKNLVSKVAQIIELVANWNTLNQQYLLPHLRRVSRITGVQASLAISKGTYDHDY